MSGAGYKIEGERTNTAYQNDIRTGGGVVNVGAVVNPYHEEKRKSDTQSLLIIAAAVVLAVYVLRR